MLAVQTKKPLNLAYLLFVTQDNSSWASRVAPRGGGRFGLCYPDAYVSSRGICNGHTLGHTSPHTYLVRYPSILAVRRCSLLINIFFFSSVGYVFRAWQMRSDGCFEDNFAASIYASIHASKCNAGSIVPTRVQSHSLPDWFHRV